MNSDRDPRRAPRRLLAIAATVAFGVGTSGIALAATGAIDAAKAIDGCYKTSTGALSLITSQHKTCGKGEKAISWNQSGPPGKQGPPGAGSSTYSTGGQFADSLGSPKTVASLPLPAGTYAYHADVNFANSSASNDNVDCMLRDASGKMIDSAAATVPASQDQVIPITSASSAGAGSAIITCSDSVNTTSARVNGAAFTATTTAALPTAGPVLRTGSVTGAGIAAGNTLTSTFAPGTCTSGSIKATVSTNQEGPGETTLSITSMTATGCSVSINNASLPVTITANSLPYSLTITDHNGDLATTGAVSWTVTVPSLGITCTYASSGLQGHWDNAINGFVMTSQSLTETTGDCPATYPVSGNVSSVADTSVSGSPLVFDS
jgi:hypothetical protein